MPAGRGEASKLVMNNTLPPASKTTDSRGGGKMGMDSMQSARVGWDPPRVEVNARDRAPVRSEKTCMKVRGDMNQERKAHTTGLEAGGRAPSLSASSGSKGSVAAMTEALFVEDIILPEQYFAPLRHKRRTGGEERLLLAVLDDAIHCFQSNIAARTPRRQRLFREAEQWLLEETDASVTLEYNCTVFGLDAEHIRARIREWRDRACAKARPAHMVAAAVPAERPESTPELQEAVCA